MKIPSQFRDAILIGGERSERSDSVEITRSFSYKLNLQNYGGKAYESADFFASRKIRCASEAVEWVSQEMYEECVADVRKAVKQHIEEMQRKARPASRSEVA